MSSLENVSVDGNIKFWKYECRWQRCVLRIPSPSEDGVVVLQHLRPWLLT